MPGPAPLIDTLPSQSQLVQSWGLIWSDPRCNVFSIITRPSLSLEESSYAFLPFPQMQGLTEPWSRTVSVSWGISVNQTIPTPSLEVLPWAQLCQAWCHNVSAGRVFVVSLGCIPPLPMATLAHFSWELPSCRERPLAFSFQPAFIEFHLHFFFPFQIGTSFILDFKLHSSLRAFSFPSCICWHTVNLFFASTPLLPAPPPKQAIKCLQLCLYYPSLSMPRRGTSWNIAEPLPLTKGDNLKTFLLFFGKPMAQKKVHHFIVNAF